jgi:uncharacterized protein (TIGR02246 family)
MRSGAALYLLLVVGAIAGRNGLIEIGAAGAAATAVQQGTQQQPRTEGAAPAAVIAIPAPQLQEEREIRKFDDLYVRDFNRGDTKALAARFTEDAEIVEEDGFRYRGRDLIAERLTETFAASPGVKMVIEVEGIHLLGAHAAKEEGRTIVTPAKGGPARHRRYTALLVKRDESWLLSSVREEHDPMVSPHDRLQVLSWMLGDWIDEGPDAVVRVNCRWSEDGNFLIRLFTVKHQGKDVMTVTQRIGWDPAAKQVRSWEFDSEGGFGEGKWGGDGDRWVIKHTAIRPEGDTVTAINTMVRERPDLVRWTSTDRYVGHQAIPDEPPYAFVRVPAPPVGQAGAPNRPAPVKEQGSAPK